MFNNYNNYYGQDAYSMPNNYNYNMSNNLNYNMPNSYNCNMPNNNNYIMPNNNNYNMPNNYNYNMPNNYNYNYAKEDIITVITYNIRHGVGLDNKLDLERIANVVKAENPDVVAFQEVDVKTKRTRKLDESKILGDLAGFKSFFGKSIPYGGGEYGNAIITRDRNAVLINHFPLPGKEPRCLLAIQSRTKMGTPFIFACTHLCLDETNRIKSTEIINNWVRRVPYPTILVGDMNCKTDSIPYKKFLKVWDSTWGAKPLPTFPANKPKTAIDHCLTYPKYKWNVKEIKVIDEKVASDHRPLKITLKLSN